MARKPRPKTPPSGDDGSQSVGWLNRQQRQQYLEARISSTFSGPLPPPEILIRYNEAVPDAAERILAMAEKQSAHRISLEDRALTADIGRSNWGLIAGFAVAVVFGIGSFACILSGYSVEGLGLGGMTIVSLVGTFVYGNESKKSYLRERAKMFIGAPD